MILLDWLPTTVVNSRRLLLFPIGCALLRIGVLLRASVLVGRERGRILLRLLLGMVDVNSIVVTLRLAPAIARRAVDA